jgi:cation transporter-like permease
MYCANCGTQNTDDATNCVSCKSAIEKQPITQNNGSSGATLPSQQNNVEKIDSHLVLAIVCFVFFWLIGIVAIIYAARVSTLVASGDIEGARKSSKNAKTWGWAGIIISIVIMAIYIIAAIFVASSGDMNTY